MGSRYPVRGYRDASASRAFNGLDGANDNVPGGAKRTGGAPPRPANDNTARRPYGGRSPFRDLPPPRPGIPPPGAPVPPPSRIPGVPDATRGRSLAGLAGKAARGLLGAGWLLEGANWWAKQWLAAHAPSTGVIAGGFDLVLDCGITPTLGPFKGSGNCGAWYIPGGVDGVQWSWQGQVLQNGQWYDQWFGQCTFIGPPGEPEWALGSRVYHKQELIWVGADPYPNPPAPNPYIETVPGGGVPANAPYPYRLPQLDPLANPPFAPQPEPVPPPWRLIPQRQPNPWRDPSEQSERGPVPRPRHDPRPRTDPRTRPLGDPRTDPRTDPRRDPRLDPPTLPRVEHDFRPDRRGDPKTRIDPNPPPHRREPPGRDTKERKARAPWWMAAGFTLSEAHDLIEGLWDALPAKLRAKLGKNRSGLEKMSDLYRYLDQVDLADAIENIAWNEFQDRVAARLGRYSDRARRDLNLSHGRQIDGFIGV